MIWQKVKLLGWVLLAVGASAFQAEAKLKEVEIRVCCYDESNSLKAGSERGWKGSWSWAVQSNGRPFLLTGYALQDKDGNPLFLSTHSHRSEVEKICGLVKPSAFARARDSYFSKGHEIFYPEETSGLQLFRDSLSFVPDSTFDDFLKMTETLLEIHEEPDTRKHSHILSSALQPFLTSHLRVNGPLDVHQQNALELILQYGATPDMQILHYQMNVAGGFQRGAFNSYIDVITDAFKEKVEGTILFPPDLFVASNPDHPFMLELIRLFTLLGYLKSTNELVRQKMDRQDLSVEDRFDYLLNLDPSYSIQVQEGLDSVSRLIELLQEKPVWVSILEKLKTDLTQVL